MILTDADIDAFINEYSEFQLDYGGSAVVTPWTSDNSVKRFYNWLAENPQVLMASGFQEYVGAHQFRLYGRLVRSRTLINAARPAFRSYNGQWILVSTVEPSSHSPWDGYSLEELRNLASHGFDDYDVSDEKAVVDLPSADEIIAAAKKYVGSEWYDDTLFVSPKLWTPFNQNREKVHLESAARRILNDIRAEKKDLRSIGWRTLEEIVAEILRSKGMEIHLVDETPQGGRDIIARGELIPGTEPVTIAVEVKHMAVVDRPLVQAALYQNRHFPALLFATSGRFTAGVIRETKLPENRLRLFLKDGVAIGELINTYQLGAL